MTDNRYYTSGNNNIKDATFEPTDVITFLRTFDHISVTRFSTQT